MKLEFGQPPAGADRNQSRSDRLSKHAHDRLESWTLVSEVWELVLNETRHEDQAKAYANGLVPNDVFEEAIDRVHAAKTTPAKRPHSTTSNT